MPPVIKHPLKGPSKSLKVPSPTLHPGLTVGLFHGSDPGPYCDRCRKVPAELIAGPAEAIGSYLCRHCWGRVA